MARKREFIPDEPPRTRSFIDPEGGGPKEIVKPGPRFILESEIMKIANQALTSRMKRIEKKLTLMVLDVLDTALKKRGL
jgi:hypothetical protein